MIFKDTIYDIWSSTLRDYNKLAPSSLLYWETIKYWSLKGFKVFDFGRSSIDDGAYKYKKQFGGEEKHLYWQYYLNNGGKMPELSVDSPKYRLATAIWKRLPVSVTKFVGPRIVKFIP